MAKLLRERGSELAALAHPLVNALTEAQFTDRYPGFDLEDPDWPTFKREIEDVGKLVEAGVFEAGG